MRFSESPSYNHLDYPLGPWTVNAPETVYDGICLGPCCYDYWEEEEDDNGYLLFDPLSQNNW